MEDYPMLTAIIQQNPGISTEEALKMYSELIRGARVIHAQPKTGVPSAPMAAVDGGQGSEESNAAKESLTKGYTKRSLKVQPNDAIKKDNIFCCICGKGMQSINARHLASHNGLTKAGYLKLCGYPDDKSLMSLNHLAKMKTQVVKAQEAREKKRAESGKAPAKVRKNKKETATA